MPSLAVQQEAKLDLLALRLKLTDRNITKRVFVSTGNLENKTRVLPSIAKLVPLTVEIFATEGTSQFLNERGIPNHMVGKISDPDATDTAQSLLAQQRFDLVVNILTGDPDYDEQSDFRIIRGLAVYKQLPLITDADVAIATIEKLVADIEAARSRTTAEPRDMREYFAGLVLTRGGYANYHAHFDKSHLMTPEYLNLGQIDMQRKWKLYKSLKEGAEYSEEGLYLRIRKALQDQIDQGVTHCRTLIDADETIKLRAIEAALRVREELGDQIIFEIGTQPLEGVVQPGPRHWFEKACSMVDVVGGLPSKDIQYPEQHLETILKIGQNLGHRVDVHVDQENNPNEKETELLARMTMKLGMEGQVSAIHSISLAAHPITYQEDVIKMLSDAGVSVIVCPSAALSMKPHEDKTALIHNSIAPVNRLIEGGVKVVLGTDNIYDFFMPFTDGDMWTEVRMLMEACRWYDAEAIAGIACDTSLFMPRHALVG